MKYRYKKVFFVIISLFVFSLINAQKTRTQRPNIVFMLVDDVGWTDFGCYGSKYYETPNIDKLAAKGIRFTNNYAYPQCSPSRYALMTGQNPARAGLTRAIVPSDHTEGGPAESIYNSRKEWYLADPKILDRMPAETKTLPELLKTAGYTTAIFGKWHLGTMKDDPPTKHGFDIYFGGAESGPHSYFSPYNLEFLKDGPAGEHVDDRLTTEALSFMDQQLKKKDAPFFLYMGFYDAHSPWQGKPELVERFKKKMDLSDRQMNPVYAAMIYTLDENIGRIANYLEREKILDNTIFILVSDNGGVDQMNGFGRDRRGAFPIGTTITSNEPLRAGKSTIYEGGIRVPAIVSWPGAQQGVVSDSVIAIWDWMPTLLQAAGVEKPAGQPVDGVDLAPLLKNNTSLGRTELFWHFPHYQIGPSPDNANPNFVNRPCTAIRRGNWKLIYVYDGPPELYDLSADMREIKNLAAQKPQLVKELSAAILSWLGEVNARLPIRNINANSAVR